MSVSEIKRVIPKGFDDPIALPQNAEQAKEWQDANRSWWENHPMRYDFSESVDLPEFTSEFFDVIDQRFFNDVTSYLPYKQVPFDSLINFESLPDKDVLEIGVGMRSHAQLIAPRSRTFTGIDLTTYAVMSTSERMKRFGIDGTNVEILQMDAEKLEFAEGSFDFVWSWGVIHHSSDTRRILEEIHRVLKPGGRATTMVYHRNWWNYYVYSGFFGGIMKRHLFRSGSLHEVRQTEIDGALARFYTIPEWRDLVSENFTIEDIRILGSKTELVPLPGGRLKNAVLGLIPDAVGRFFTNRCRLGTFLVSTFRK
ncbi:MAG TPA: methyltransferase domain-containing protein [Pyrinomonadaceae bacterium]|nr:methyltransferase domain-containing protein [Pyrinomonadaceae bacterium]